MIINWASRAAIVVIVGKQIAHQVPHLRQQEATLYWIDNSQSCAYWWPTV